MKEHGTLSQVLNRLRTEEGYSQDFNLQDDHLALKAKDEKFTANDFTIDDVYRFEGFSNPADNAIIYAITTSSGEKGVLVDGYGAYSGQVSPELLKKLKRERP